MSKTESHVNNDLAISQMFIAGLWKFNPVTGKVYNSRHRELTGTAMKNGYMRVTTKFQGQKRNFYLHRIIYIGAHNGIIPDKDTEIDHINGNVKDNRPENLRAVTHQENCKNPNAPSGGKRRKLTDADVLRIRAIWKIKDVLPEKLRPTMKALAKEYGVTSAAISNVVNYISYKHLQLPENPPVEAPVIKTHRNPLLDEIDKLKVDCCQSKLVEVFI